MRPGKPHGRRDDVADLAPIEFLAGELRLCPVVDLLLLFWLDQAHVLVLLDEVAENLDGLVDIQGLVFDSDVDSGLDSDVTERSGLSSK